ncbi:sulfur carrier protein ThiS [Actinocorallia sp. A-T 12471]|uniref:sulfur carrier protein ThiS n=1 Tax=Actinocorallia sp. A-T 12471 TaxID=3089813 RepID=UPI0029CB8890|nr:sulfur carrier protein ThiS [Actinocorallia sp. A-T 12471]MDX6743166.1 sulfur carrier protein ThiS [Actinocorallia sp. A-T 12471]
MRVHVNGDPRDLAADVTVAEVVADVAGAGAAESGRGIAVAVNDEVVRRAAWPATRVNEGDRVEIITAVQGG